MTLKHYKPSQAHILAVKRSGFDCHDVNKRHPVQNQQLDIILASKGQSIDPRAKLLLKGREIYRAFKDRALVAASGLAIAFATPPDAFAATGIQDIDGTALFLAALLEAASWP